MSFAYDRVRDPRAGRGGGVLNREELATLHEQSALEILWAQTLQEHQVSP